MPRPRCAKASASACSSCSTPDYYASYVWDESRSVFGGRVALNMSDRNLSSYEAYYQYHDPITPKLQQHRSRLWSSRSCRRPSS